jgi:hypothetical protein
MRARLLASLGVLTLVFATVSPVSGQPGAAPAASPAAKWTPPRTADGHPDLQGTWDFRTVTPLERPAEFAGKAVLTAEEAAEYERRIVESRNADTNRDKTTSRGIINGSEITADVALAYNDFWWDRGTRVDANRRTSLIVDPPDGKIPALTPEAMQRLQSLDVARERLAEGPEDRSVAERCILGFNSGPPMVPGGYNQNVQIVQAPGYVVVFNEMVHSARIIPLDGRPHGNMPQLTGTSRGRWDGSTLVVETKNFQHETALRGSSSNMHLIERFTRVDPDTLLYEFTVTDPKTWTRPWTAQISMRRTDDLIYEYACHEANYGMTNLLKAARVMEKDAAGATTKGLDRE